MQPGRYEGTASGGPCTVASASPKTSEGLHASYLSLKRRILFLHPGPPQQILGLANASNYIPRLSTLPKYYDRTLKTS
jgi:hypothetical protein